MSPAFCCFRILCCFYQQNLPKCLSCRILRCLLQRRRDFHLHGIYGRRIFGSRHEKSRQNSRSHSRQNHLSRPKRSVSDTPMNIHTISQMQFPFDFIFDFFLTPCSWLCLHTNTLFFYKRHEPEICQNFKNKMRECPG